MRAIHCGGRGRAGLDQSVARFQTPLTVACAGGTRAALLAGASIIALATFGAPSTASACSWLDQTISTSATGPILATNGSITVDGGVTVTGHPTGVSAASCGISTLTANGLIVGGLGAVSAAGGLAISNGKTIGTLTNGGTINGGAGGASIMFGGNGGAGGTAIFNTTPSRR